MAYYRSVMIIEDDKSIREVLLCVFQEHHKRLPVYVAEDGEEALGLIDKVEKPCLVLLDLLLPHMSGAEFLARSEIGPGDPNYRVVILTASKDAIPGYEVIRKPTNIEPILDLLEGPRLAAASGHPNT